MDTSTQAIPYTKSLSGFYSAIYGWMFVGLLISAGFSYVTLNSVLGQYVYGNTFIYYGVAAIEIALLLGIQFAINRLSGQAARALFFLYAALNGITLAGLFVIYPLGNVVQIFLMAAALFATLALIGYNTKKDLSGWSGFLFAGVIAVFIASIVNIFLQNTLLDTVVSAVALLVFAALTVYDNQVYKSLYHNAVNDHAQEQRYVSLGALHMYVNFIMIFVSLLKLFGSRD